MPSSPRKKLVRKEYSWGSEQELAGRGSGEDENIALMYDVLKKKEEKILR